jgi:uncharacterized RDD family membrane protein YckC
MGDIYSPPESDLSAGMGNPVYAGFWIRTAASIIDSIWLVLLTLGLGWMIYGALYFNSEKLILGYGDFIISYVLPFIITIVFWTYKSATPGKMILGMKIVDAETLDQVSKKRLVLRYLGYYISMLGIFLGFFWVAWDKRKQGWHDKIAKTVVVKEK